MFSTLRQGSSVYILDKGNANRKPKLSIGQVESVSAPQPKLSNGNYPYMGCCTDMVVDVKVKVGEDTMDFQKLPVNLSVADIGSVTICDNREETLTAVDNFFQSSKRALEDVPYHESVVESCDSMFVQLNPVYAKDKERDSSISALKSEMSEIKDEFRGALSEIKTLLAMYAPPGVDNTKKR